MTSGSPKVATSKGKWLVVGMTNGCIQLWEPNRRIAYSMPIGAAYQQAAEAACTNGPKLNARGVAMTERERIARKWEQIAERFFAREAPNGHCWEASEVFDEGKEVYWTGPTYDAILLFEPEFYCGPFFWPPLPKYADNRMWAALLIAAMTRTGDCYPELP